MISILLNVVLALLLARSTVLAQKSAKYSFEKGYRTELGKLIQMHEEPMVSLLMLSPQLLLETGSP